MTTNYIIEKHHPSKSVPIFDESWCKPLNLRKYGLDKSLGELKVCSPEWRRQVDLLIDRKEREIYVLLGQGKGLRGANAEKIREARESLRDLFAIKSRCCIGGV